MEKKLSNYLEDLESIHRSGLIPYSIKNGKYYVAVMKPSDPKYGGTEFQFCKGQVEVGDTFKITAIKECEQELGLKVNQNEIKLLWDNKNKKIQWFYCELLTMRKMIPGPNENGIIETMDCQWMEINKAETTVRDWQRVLVKMLKRRLGI